jgi:glycosyltransferase involved in cell wall biosynthesis
VRIHVLIDSLTSGGAEVLLADLARGARPHGLEFSVGYLFADGAAAQRLHQAGVTPEPVGARGLLDLRTLSQVRRHLAGVRPDIVHTHLQYSDVLGGLAARTLGIPAVATVHVMDSRDSARAQARARLVALARRRWHRRVITVSDHLRAEYLAFGKDRQEHVLTIHNGIAAGPAPGAGAAVRAELGLSQDDVVVAMVGVLRPGKGHELAVPAIDEVRRIVPRVRLLVVGDGPARDEVARLAASLGDCVVLTGHRDDVMAVLDAADILLHPSQWDAFPTVLLEGLAAGVPIVATAVGGIPEIVEDGRTGLLVTPPLIGSAFAATLLRLLKDKALGRELAARGRKRFDEEFTAERWVGRLHSVYEQVV